MENDSTKPLGKVFRIDESEIRGRLDEMVRGTVEESLNAILDAEADELYQAARSERSPERIDTRAVHYKRKLHTNAGEVDVKMPKLRRQTFETAIIDRYRRRTKVVGTFPDGHSAPQLVTARLRHLSATQWGTRKYMNMELLKEMDREIRYLSV